MEDATALLSATECATDYPQAGVAGSYVDKPENRPPDALPAQADADTPRPQAPATNSGRRKRTRSTAGDPECSVNAPGHRAAGSESMEAVSLRDQEPVTTDTAAQPANEPLPTPERVIEALLFASDTPLSTARLADLVGGVTPAIVQDCIEVLNAEYAASGRAFRISAIAGGYQMLTTPVFQPWLSRLDKHRGQHRLGDAALEVLSIIAYKQPIIRAEIEAIRGVACGEVMNRLRDMGLIKAVGRAEVIGRPLLYGTTRKFLDTFGLERLEDLPPLEAIQLKSRSANDGKSAEPKDE